MKKVFICLFMFFGILSFALWNVLLGDVKTVKEGSWCTGKGSYSFTTKSGGIVRWHERCYTNVVIKYVGFDHHYVEDQHFT